jgi:hypothetical protein
MGRWSHLDSDEDRLPAGMSRVGYDADTQIYTYRDSDGSFWEGAPGCRYGKLHRVRSAPPLPSVQIPNDIAGVEQPYVLHDYDDDNSTDSDGNKSYESGDDDEKLGAFDEKKQLPLKPVLTTPTKARLHNRSPKQQQRPHHHHHRPAAPGKTLPDVDLPELCTKLTGTTIAESTISDSDTYRPPSQNGRDRQKKPTLLKRAGTLSRLTRFLSSSSSSSYSSASARSPAVSRRATVAGRNQALASSEGGGSSGRWPGQGQGAGNRVPRRRATTFDEILGGLDGAR